MKKLFVSIIVLLLVNSVFSQSPIRDKDYYLKKSKNQQNAGWVFLGGGTAMLTAGIIIGNTQTSANDVSIPDSSGFLILGGLLADLTSIPFFVSSAKNARTAAVMSNNNQRKAEGKGDTISFNHHDNPEFKCSQIEE